MYPIPAAGNAREVVEPPFMVRADLAAAPFRGADHAHIAFEVGEVKLPVVAFAIYTGWIIPIVILLAVRREMDISTGGFAGGDLVVSRKAIP